MQEHKELLRDQRDKLVKSILDELDELSYKKSTNYLEKVPQLPHINSKEPSMDIVRHFREEKKLLSSIRNASDKITKSTLGTIPYYVGVINNIIEAFDMHNKVISETGPSKMLLPIKNKNEISLSREGSQQSMNLSNQTHTDGKLPSIRPTPKYALDNRQQTIDSSDSVAKLPGMTVYFNPIISL